MAVAMSWGDAFCGRPYNKSPTMFGVYMRGSLIVGNSHVSFGQNFKSTGHGSPTRTLVGSKIEAMEQMKGPSLELPYSASERLCRFTREQSRLPEVRRCLETPRSSLYLHLYLFLSTHVSAHIYTSIYRCTCIYIHAYM